jgi:hypothetical protein
MLDMAVWESNFLQMLLLLNATSRSVEARPHKSNTVINTPYIVVCK